MRNIFDSARIGGDVLPHAAVSAGGRPDKAAILIDQIDRQAIDFQLGQIRAGRGAGQPAAQLLLIENIVQAVKAFEVLNRLEHFPVGRRVDLRTDLLRGAVRHHQIGPLLL